MKYSAIAKVTGVLVLSAFAVVLCFGQAINATGGGGGTNPVFPSSSGGGTNAVSDARYVIKSGNSSGAQSLDGSLTISNSLSVTGAVVAASFAGDGSALTGISAGNVFTNSAINLNDYVTGVTNSFFVGPVLVGRGTLGPVLWSSGSGSASGAVTRWKSFVNTASGNELELIQDSGGNRYLQANAGFLTTTNLTSGAATFAGSVGIGTNTAFATLSVPITTTATNAWGTLSLGGGVWSAGASGAFLGLNAGTHIAVNALASSSSDMINLQQAGTNRFLVNNKGWIASGVSNALYAIDVQATNAASQIHISPQANMDNGGYFTSVNGATYISTGNAYDGANWFAKTNAATIFGPSTTGHFWYLNSGLTIGNTFTPSEIMRLTATSLGVFNSSPSATLHVGGTTKLGTTGTAINASYATNYTMTLASIAAGTSFDTNITLTSALTNSTVIGNCSFKTNAFTVSYGCTNNGQISVTFDNGMLVNPIVPGTLTIWVRDFTQ